LKFSGNGYFNIIVKHKGEVLDDISLYDETYTTGKSFMENEAGWHGTAPNDEQRNEAISQLDEVLKKLEVE
jgi:hypothetical protein